MARVVFIDKVIFLATLCRGGLHHRYTEIGYDFLREAFYVDHTYCCGNSSHSIDDNSRSLFGHVTATMAPVVQRAPLATTRLGALLSLAVFVDGGLIEAFLG